ncbi:MAG TPA: RcnB family protein [Caulobacteraceae bacterium]|jgi:Ni/Co efflux regulator RcnB|nr:RcnB family protein [Caulobacteraceae bacterium]
MKRLLASALALSLLGGSAAMAQSGYGDRGDHRNDQRDARQYEAGHHWTRGQRLPQAYYQDNSRYVDYRTYHLRRPPHGYRWVRTDDNNYALVAITTGLIASIIAASH